MDYKTTFTIDLDYRPQNFTFGSDIVAVMDDEIPQDFIDAMREIDEGPTLAERCKAKGCKPANRPRGAHPFTG